jgi:DNA replication protein DnaC
MAWKAAFGRHGGSLPPAGNHWHGVIKDPTVADAVFDRLVHKAHRIALTGESMRKAAPDS